MGVIEFEDPMTLAWHEADRQDFEVFVAYLIRRQPPMVYRYREGTRAVYLWPEERMGEVVDCG